MKRYTLLKISTFNGSGESKTQYVKKEVTSRELHLLASRKDSDENQSGKEEEE